MNTSSTSDDPPPPPPVPRAPDAPAGPAVPPSLPPPGPPAIARSLLPPHQLPYPVRYEVAYPERLSRRKTLLRLPLLVPVLLFLYLVQTVIYALFSVGWTTVFFKRKYPQWAFAGGAGAMGYAARASAYLLLQTDRFPSFSYDHPDVVLEFAEPPSGSLSRWRVLFWKLVLLIPHFLVLSVLQSALAVVTLLAWFGILFTGNYPRGMFAFATGVMRWQFRVAAYFASYTDRYPPYALSREAAPAGNQAVVWSGIAGAAAVAGLAALIAVAVALTGGTRHQTVSYAALQRGQSAPTINFTPIDGSIEIRLARIYDPGESLAGILKPSGDEKVVVLEWVVRNRTGQSRLIPAAAATLKLENGHHTTIHSQFIVVDGRAGSASIEHATSATVQAVFIVPRESPIKSATFHAGWTRRGGIVYTFTR